jgi:CubicO group peptidase (beta-lactamase class C family)
MKGWLNGTGQSANIILTFNTSYLAPSAGLYSTAREMIKWVKFNLDEGRVGDRQLVSKRSMKWVHRSHMVVGASAAFKSEDVTYGQGWFRSQHRGHLLVSHGGSFNGHRTTMAFVPGLDLGVIAICNLNLTEYPELLIRVVFDQLLGIDAISEWNQHLGNSRIRVGTENVPRQTTFERLGASRIPRVTSCRPMPARTPIRATAHSSLRSTAKGLCRPTMDGRLTSNSTTVRRLRHAGNLRKTICSISR